MSRVRVREILFAGLALSLVAAGVAVDLRGGRRVPAGAAPVGPASAMARFHERAVFCPATERTRPGGTERKRRASTKRVRPGNTERKRRASTKRVRPGNTERKQRDEAERSRPGGKRPGRPSRALSVHAPKAKGVEVLARPWIRHPLSVQGRVLWLAGAARRVVNVVGSGRPVTAAQLATWPASAGEGRGQPAFSGGAGASGCSPVASDRWYFPSGASTVGWDERISIVNPFPDDAVAMVTFAARRPVRAQPPQEVAVPARSSVQVEVNRMALPDPSLAATLTVLRGRVAAWKTIFRAPELERHRLARPPESPPGDTSPDGVLFSLGATTASARWYFPEAGAGKGRATTLALLNPATQPATVTVSLIGRRDIVQPPGLVGVPVPAGGSVTLALKAPPARRGRVRSFGAVVASRDGVEVVAERSMSYDTPRLEGVALEIGAPRSARRWSLAPAVAHPREDDVVVLNPGSKEAVLDLSVLRPSRPPLAPPGLQDLLVAGGSRRTIAVPEGPRGRGSAVVLLRSSAPVVAERRAYSRAYGDVASIMGEALPLRLE